MSFTLDLLHGFMGKPADWDKLFDENFSDLNVIAHDVLKISSPSAQIGMHEWADKFHKHIKMDVTNHARNHRILVGYSMGGRLAMHALLRAPLLWKGAILICAHPGLESPHEKMQRLQNDLSWKEKFQHSEWADLMQEWNKREVFSDTSFKFTRLLRDYSRNELADILCYWSLGWQDCLSEQINQLEIPILWMAGSKDHTYSQIAKKHPMHWIAEDAGHRVPWEKPKQFKQQVINFIHKLNGENQNDTNED